MRRVRDRNAIGGPRYEVCSVQLSAPGPRQQRTISSVRPTPENANVSSSSCQRSRSPRLHRLRNPINCLGARASPLQCLRSLSTRRRTDHPRRDHDAMQRSAGWGCSPSASQPPVLMKNAGNRFKISILTTEMTKSADVEGVSFRECLVSRLLVEPGFSRSHSCKQT